MIYHTGLPRPSFQNDFARSRRESAYPGLWDGLVGIWSTTMGVQAGTLRDFSGRGRHGTNSFPDWRMTELGWSHLFSGGTSDCFVMPTDAEINDVGVRFTVMARVKPNGAQSLQAGIFENLSPGSFNGFYLGVSHLDVAYLRVYAGTNLQMPSPFSTTDWTHIAMVCTGVHHIGYQNGRQGNFATSSASRVGTQPRIGRYNLGNVNWKGWIDDCRIYNRALTPGEIMASYLGASPLTLRRRVVGKAPAGGGGGGGTILKHIQQMAA